MEVDTPLANVVRAIPRVAEHFRTLVADFEARAAQASPRDIARARTDLRALLGVVRVEGVAEEGRLVPYGLVEGVGRTLLCAAAGAQQLDSKGVDICGSGGCFELYSVYPIRLLAVPASIGPAE